MVCFSFEIISNLLFLFFMTLTFLRITRKLLFQRVLQLSDVSSCLDSKLASQAENHRKDAVLFLLHLIMWYTILVCPITSEVNLDRMTEPVSARFLLCKVPFFPFIFSIIFYINQCFMKEVLKDSVNILFCIYLLLLV